MGSPALLSVDGLAITYRNRWGLHEVCSDVTFDVAPGEAVAVIGESGSGKSVTVLAVTGLLGAGGAIARGNIHFDGQDITRLSSRDRRRMGLRGRKIGMIFQNPSRALDPVFSIGQQLAESLRQTGRLSTTELHRKSADWLRMVGLPDPEEQLSRYPHQLSGGQKQRVMIAVALASEPRLLIADEPTTALDVTIQAQVLQLMARLRRELGLALLLVTHDFGVVAAVADRVVVMYAGEVVETGTVAQIVRAPRHPYTRALIASLPTGVPGTPIQALPGAVPTAREMPSGCRFHPRCPIAEAQCRLRAPTLDPAAEGRRIRCLLAERTPA